ncbi:hypothetical protein D3C76_522090 [compost metagenome]
MQLAGQLVTYIKRQALAAMSAVDRQLDLMTFAHQAFGDTGADPVTAPVDHQHRTPRFHLIAQHLPGVHYLKLAGTLERRPVGGGAGSGNDQIRALTFDQRAVDPGVAHHFYTCQGHFPLKVGAGTPELATPWQ